MSTPAWRESAAIATIGLAVGVGAHLVGVAPVHSLSGRLALERRELQAEVSRLDAMSQRVADLARALQDTRAGRLAIDQRSHTALQPRLLFELLHELADRAGLVIERLDPAPPAAIPPAAAGAQDRAVRYSIVARGPFAGVVRFMGALATDAGYCRVSAADLRPVYDDARDEVLVSIDTEHWAFDTAPAPEGGAP